MNVSENRLYFLSVATYALGVCFGSNTFFEIFYCFVLTIPIHFLIVFIQRQRRHV